MKLLVFRDIETAAFWKVALTALVGAILITATIAALGGNIDLAHPGQMLRDMSISVMIGFSLWLNGGYLNSWLTHQVDWLERPRRGFLISLAANVVTVALITTLCLAVYVIGILGIEASRFPDVISRSSYITSITISLLITAIYQSAYFLNTWKASLVQAEQLKVANLAAQFEALNAQINPHFLFNSLNVLSALIRSDAERAESFIQGLSAVYRYVLEVRRETLVPLGRELDMLHAYANLLTTRFGDRLRLEIGPQSGEDVYVVPLALQMLVENAVKHNGATRDKPLGVCLRREPEWLVVANNVSPLFEPAEGKGVGLGNISERYRLAAGREIRIEHSTERFEVWLPVLYR